MILLIIQFDYEEQEDMSVKFDISFANSASLETLWPFRCQGHRLRRRSSPAFSEVDPSVVIERAEKIAGFSAKSMVTLMAEKLWRMPLDKDYDKIMNSKFADIKEQLGPSVRLAPSPLCSSSSVLLAKYHRRISISPSSAWDQRSSKSTSPGDRATACGC